MAARLICIFALCFASGCATTRGSDDEFRFATEPMPPQEEAPKRHFAEDIPRHAGNVFVVACHVTTLALYPFALIFGGGTIGPYTPPDFVNPWEDF